MRNLIVFWKGKSYMSIKRIIFFLIFGCCLFGRTISSFAAPANVEAFLETHVVSDTVSYIDFFEGHYEGEYMGKLAIGSANACIDTYYVDVYSGAEYAQQITDEENTGTYFRYGDYHGFGDHNDQGFADLANVQPGDIAALFAVSENGTYFVKEIYKCIKTCIGHNEGYLYDENHTELSTLKESGSVIMYTCDSSGGDKIFLTFWEQVDDFNSLFKASLLKELIF